MMSAMVSMFPMLVVRVPVTRTMNAVMAVVVTAGPMSFMAVMLVG